MKSHGTKRVRQEDSGKVAIYTHVVSFTCDAQTMRALDTIIERMTERDGQPTTASAAIREAIAYTELKTRKVQK